MAAKETPKTKKAKPQSRVKASAVTERPTYAELRQQLAEALEREKTALKKLQDRDEQLVEALEQQAATSEILGVIASSPTNIQPVLSTIAENAARVCSADDAVIRLLEGNLLRLGAHYGNIPHVPPERQLDRSSIFVFQAEDGIRVLYVTGVQTCALPISSSRTVGRCSRAVGFCGRSAIRPGR